MALIIFEGDSLCVTMERPCIITEHYLSSGSGINDMIDETLV